MNNIDLHNVKAAELINSQWMDEHKKIIAAAVLDVTEKRLAQMPIPIATFDHRGFRPAINDGGRYRDHLDDKIILNAFIRDLNS